MEHFGEHFVFEPAARFYFWRFGKKIFKTARPPTCPPPRHQVGGSPDFLFVSLPLTATAGSSRCLKLRLSSFEELQTTPLLQQGAIRQLSEQGETVSRQSADLKEQIVSKCSALIKLIKEHQTVALQGILEPYMRGLYHGKPVGSVWEVCGKPGINVWEVRGKPLGRLCEAGFAVGARKGYAETLPPRGGG